VIAPPGARPGAVTAAGVLAFAAGGLLVVLHLWTLLVLLAYSRGGIAAARADPPRYLRPGFATTTRVTPRANAPTTISGCHHCAPSQ
jgi:hypothetical protein